MIKRLLYIAFLSSQLVFLYANDKDSKRYYLGCQDINLSNFNTKNALYMKSLITNDLKVKFDLLEALDFKISRNLDFRHVCAQIKNKSYDDHMYSYIQDIQVSLILKYNNILYSEYDKRMSSRLNNAKK